MHTWDKLYQSLKKILQQKTLIAQLLWSLSRLELYFPWKRQLLELWRIQVSHTISLNKILQQLGYTQIKINCKNQDQATVDNQDIQKIIELTEFWLPILEKHKEESFGSDIYFALCQIIADDTVMAEILVDLNSSVSKNG